MSWTDLFRRQGSKLVPDSRVRWFGKLPNYEDYYSSPTEQPWVVEFREWVLRGFEADQSREALTARSTGESMRSRVVLRLPKSDVTVFADLQDYGGDSLGRPFPFCCFVGVPTQVWPGPEPEGVDPMMGVLDDLAVQQMELGGLGRTRVRYQPVFSERTVDLERIVRNATNPDWSAGLDGVTFDDWYRGTLMHREGIEPGQWLTRVRHWREVASHAKPRKNRPTVRLPMSDTVPAGVQISGWLLWLGTKLRFGRRSLTLILSDPRGEGSMRLSVIPRPPVPDDFLLLAQDGSLPRGVDDLCQIQPSKDPMGPISSQHPDSAPYVHWLDFVRSD